MSNYYEVMNGRRLMPVTNDIFEIQVRVPSSDCVAEIVGRNGAKIKELRARTSTKISTPKRGEEPVFTIIGTIQNISYAKEQIELAVSHFTYIRSGLQVQPKVPNPILSPSSFFWGNITYDHIVREQDIGIVVGLRGSTVKWIQKKTLTCIVSPQRFPNIPVFKITGNPINVKFASLLIDALIKARLKESENSFSLSIDQIFENVIQTQKDNDFVDFVYFVFHIISNKSKESSDLTALLNIYDIILKIFQGNHVNSVEPNQWSYELKQPLTYDMANMSDSYYETDLNKYNFNVFNLNNCSNTLSSYSTNLNKYTTNIHQEQLNVLQTYPIADETSIESIYPFRLNSHSSAWNLNVQTAALDASPSCDQFKNENIQGGNVLESILKIRSNGYNNNDDTCQKCCLKGRVMFNDRVCFDCQMNMSNSL